jgi:hypothetical protein
VDGEIRGPDAVSGSKQYIDEWIATLSRGKGRELESTRKRQRLENDPNDPSALVYPDNPV